MQPQIFLKVINMRFIGQSWVNIFPKLQFLLLEYRSIFERELQARRSMFLCGRWEGGRKEEGWMNFFESALCYSSVSSAKQNFPMCFSIDLTLY